MTKVVPSCVPRVRGRLGYLLIVAGVVGLGLPARAEPAAEVQPRAVVELFTSQGCSSCPPADRLLIDLASRPDVIALAMHVDYWDRLGWRDTLGSRAFTLRQRAYAARRGDGEVYTPQAVVNGSAHRLGSDPDAITEAGATTSGRGGALTVPVSLEERDGRVLVRVGAAGAQGPRAGEVLLLTVSRRVDVAIARGENRGRSITYVNIVREIVPLGSWTGQAATFGAPLPAAREGGAEGLVVLLQDNTGGPGAILGAAQKL